MFLKVHSRSKDGKEHRYYSLVESVRTSRGPQHRTLAYLGELNGSSESAWRRSIAVFNGEGTECQLELFAADAAVVPSGERVAEVLLDRVRWERARDFGELFLVQHLWRLLGLDAVLEERMEPGGEQIPWPVMSFILTAARLIAHSSELAVEERFYPRTALEDLCGVPEERVNKGRGKPDPAGVRGGPYWCVSVWRRKVITRILDHIRKRDRGSRPPPLLQPAVAHIA